MYEPERVTRDVERDGAGREPKAESREPLVCDWCGSLALDWVKCKLICQNCRQIVKSCADL